MHADVHGAATVVIRNYMSIPATGTAIPQYCRISDVTLQQAAVFALCHSVSWDNNLINKVYWVFDYQVSKTAPTGEYLPTGSFMIRGKKNYLAPYRLELGVGLLFEVEAEDAEKHRFERKRKDLTDEAWEQVIAEGRPGEVADSEGEVVEDDDDDEEFTVEVMNEVRNTAKPKPVVKVQAVAKGQKNKKSLKGTTKKSRAQAEEEAYLNEGVEEEKPKGKEMSRGERRKMKKAKKYAECDDEESKWGCVECVTRRLRSVLYGHSSIESILKGSSEKEKTSEKNSSEKKEKGEEKKEKNSSQKDEGTDKDDLPNSVSENASLEDIDAYLQQLVSLDAAPAQITCYTCGSSEHDQAHCPESWRVIEHIDQKEEEKEEKENDNEEEEDAAIPAAERDTSDLLLNWTAMPQETDRIVHAIPVCAPYAAMSDYTYHVKMTVGKMKKGAMAKSIVEHWLKGKIPEAQKKSIRQIPVEDISAIIMNNSKVVLPGGTKGKKWSVCFIHSPRFPFAARLEWRTRQKQQRKRNRRRGKPARCIRSARKRNRIRAPDTGNPWRNTCFTSLFA